MRSFGSALSLSLLAVLGVAAPSSAAVNLTTTVVDFSAANPAGVCPVLVTHAGDASRRLFVLDKRGYVWQRDPANPTEVLATPFPETPYQGPRLAPLRPLKLAYVAKMSWAPNRAGAERLLAEVMPALPAGAAEFHFYGPGTEAFAGRHPALRGHGVVDSLDEVWRNTHFTLCPVESGFGLQACRVAV